MASLEQHPDFVILRRILRAVEPEYVLFTNRELPPENSLLDIDRKSIVISDLTESSAAIPIVLFQIGQLAASSRHKPLDSYAELSQMALWLNRRDRLSAHWAFTTTMLYWPESDPSVLRKQLRGLITSSFEWLKIIRS